MIYVDTSVLVALHTDERFTSSVSAWYGSLTDTALVTADWTVPEFASALENKKRSGELDARRALRIWRHFEDQCTADLRLLPVERNAFLLAASLIRETPTGLRAGDALHLAVARQAATDQIATLDIVFAKSAKARQMRVLNFKDPFDPVAPKSRASTRK